MRFSSPSLISLRKPQCFLGLESLFLAGGVAMLSMIPELSWSQLLHPEGGFLEMLGHFTNAELEYC